MPHTDKYRANPAVATLPRERISSSNWTNLALIAAAMNSQALEGLRWQLNERVISHGEKPVVELFSFETAVSGVSNLLRSALSRVLRSHPELLALVPPAIRVTPSAMTFRRGLPGTNHSSQFADAGFSPTYLQTFLNLYGRMQQYRYSPSSSRDFFFGNRRGVMRCEAATKSGVCL